MKTLEVPTLDTDSAYSEAKAVHDAAEAEFAAAFEAYRDLDAKRDEVKNATADYVDRHGSVISEDEFLRLRSADGSDPARPRTASELTLARFRAAESGKADAARHLYSVTQAARERLRAQFEASDAYRALVRTVIDDWAARLASALALVATVKQAEQHGVSGLHVPPVLYAEIGQLAAYCNAQKRAGVISARDFPDALGELPVALRGVVTP